MMRIVCVTMAQVEDILLREELDALQVGHGFQLQPHLENAAAAVRARWRLAAAYSCDPMRRMRLQL